MPPVYITIYAARGILYSILGNLFTPWFKLIARDFLFGWWDELLKRKGVDGKVTAKSLNGLVDGSKVVKMV
jgi:isopentenyl-diphosphate delta-isomerase